MKSKILARIALCCLVLAPQTARAFPVDFGPGFTTHRVSVDGNVVSVTVGGHGPVVVLLHRYAEDSRMWKPLAIALAPRFTVVAPDLPGIGNSSIPASGLDMKSAARTVRDAVRALGFRRVRVVGHDIGLMVAYAYAAMYRSEVERLALMDAFLPGIAGWEAIYNNPDLWHFRFHGPTPLALVAGRERIYFNYYWNDFAADPNRSLSQADRNGYIAAYSRPGRMAAGWAYFEAFPRTAVDFAKLGATKLTIPVLSIGGDKANGAALAAQAELISSKVTVVVLPNTGHWLMEENPSTTMLALKNFLMTSLTMRDQASDQLLTPKNAALVLIDYQPVQVNSIMSMDRHELVDNVVRVARTAQAFQLPIVLSTVNVKTGINLPMIDELLQLHFNVEPIDRTSINAWEDADFLSAVTATGRKKLIMAALWTEVCLVFPALDALHEGYDVYAVADAVGGTSVTAHQAGLARIAQAGGRLTSWVQMTCELQRDWIRIATVPQFKEILFGRIHEPVGG